MNEIMELLNSLGESPAIIAGGGVAGLLAIFLFLKKKKGGKKTSSGGGGYEYGDTTTAGYDTKAGNFVDELNSDSVLTQDVHDFAVPNFDREELERTTASRGYKKKKIFNSALPGMTLGDSRPMVPQVEEDIEDSLELRSEIKATTRSSVSGFGLKPKSMNAMDIATITTSGLKVLDDVEQLMRPAAPEKVSADSPVQSINIPMSMKIADVDTPEKETVVASFDLNFGDIPAVPVVEDEKHELNFSTLPEIKIPNIDDAPSVHSEDVKINVEMPQETTDLFSTSGQVPDTLEFFTMDTIPSEEGNQSSNSVDDIDLSDIPGLNLSEVDSAAQSSAIAPQPIEFIQEEEPGFTKVLTKLDETQYPETVAYHQEINTALFLDDEGMKEQALQTLQNAVELVKNIKVKFYFKLAIQSYVNNTKEKALPDIIKNFYDFEYEKYSK